MSKTKEPRFVNLQSGVVTVFDDKLHRIEVASWDRRKSDDDPDCVVTGEHFRQFVSAKGPLYPFPGEAPEAPVYAKSNPTTLESKPVEDSGAPDSQPTPATPEAIQASAEANARSKLTAMGFTPAYLDKHADQIIDILASATACEEMGLNQIEVKVNVEREYELPGEFPEGYFAAFEEDVDEEADEPEEEDEAPEKPKAKPGRLGRKRK